MTSYFIEVRLTGKIQREIKSLISEVRKKYGLQGERPVPHIAVIYRPTPVNMSKHDEKQLIKDFAYVCSRQEKIMECKLDGFGNFVDKGVAIIKVEPDDSFVQFRKELIRLLRTSCGLHEEFDRENEFESHITIAKKLTSDKLNKVMRYLKEWKGVPKQRYCLSRVTLLKNEVKNIEESKILVEYDFFLNRLLNRQQSKNRSIQRETTLKLKEYLADKQAFNISRTKRNLPMSQANFFSKIRNSFVRFFRF